MIGNAEMNQSNDTTKLSLRNLQDLLFDVDDLIDTLPSLMFILTTSLLFALSSAIAVVLRSSSSELISPSPLSAIRTHIGTLNEIKPYLTNIPSTNIEKSENKPGDSFRSNPQIFGRETDKEKLIHTILSDKVSLVPIVGLMGIGKTTLAHLIYNDGRISQHFNVRVWVHVGRNSDKPIILHTFLADQQYSPDKEDTLAGIKKMLHIFSQREERFLLVLDDCWDKDFCESLSRAVIDNNSIGSAIIVTTHSTSLASAFRTAPAYHLTGLSSEASYQMLKEKAIHIFQNDPAGFEPIAREIVELCRGVPLILRIVGDILHNMSTMEELESVLARLEHSSFDEITEKFTPYYDVLPSHLKLPFQTFFLQKACGLSVHALTCVWMALGFLYLPDTPDPTQLLDMGREYLRQFAALDLFTDVKYATGGVVRDIDLDHHMYGLALYKARNQWAVIHDLPSQRIDDIARHIIWVVDPPPITVPSDLLKARNARLFILHAKGHALEKLVRGIVSGFKRLRVLGLGGCDIEKLPGCVGKLKHLRYLDIGRNARLKCLPDSIFELRYLQTLLLHGCELLKKVPASIGQLKNLMYLTLTTRQESLPEEIGKLTSLKTLGLASCQRLASLPRSIKSLERLQTLALVECPVLDIDSSVEVLKGNEGIETLLLKGLPIFASLPSDMGSLSVFVKHLAIQSCKHLTETVWISQFVSLRSLTIEGCGKLSGLADATSQFNSLVELIIRRCPSLDHTTWIMHFVSLRSLIIDDCLNLVALDTAFSNLKKLERLDISGCPLLTERLARPAGEDWHLIEHVQLIQLDGESLNH